MIVQKEVSRDEVILAVNGSLSGEATNEFHFRLEQLASGQYLTVSLDLSQTPSINSSALGKILLFRKKLADGGRTLQIVACSDALFKTFQMIQFDKLVTIKK
ncbi:MAG TPA: STAS domain-containing protein [Spirochaetia bacterium]|nr:STAS domain-containing protein [Spirochaetia bacterium]